MFSNFIKIALRNITKHKTYSIINFVGLTCGLTLSLLIMAYVREEFSYDTFHEKADRIYRIKYTVLNGLELASCPAAMAPHMLDYFPEMEAVARVYGRNATVSVPSKNDVVFEESGVYFVDSTLLNIFTLEFVSGNPHRALADPYTLLINEAMATKYFGNENPIGETLLFSGKNSFKIVGVFKDKPNAHIRFNMIAPFENMYDMEDDVTSERLRNNLRQNFVISHSYTYMLLKPGAKAADVDAKMGDFLKEHAAPQNLIGQVFTLYPLLDIHLQSEMQAEPGSPNSMTTVYIFIGIGILTLMIACINYINLVTAQSVSRIKEIGIRKIMGSTGRQLVFQFLSESFLFCLIAILLSFILLYYALPFLNDLTSNEIDYWSIVDVNTVYISIVLLLGVTIFAGSYPAWFIANFQTVNSLKGSGFTSQDGSSMLRRGLVVFQLVITSLLLSGSMMIFKQLHFLSNQPLGFNKDMIITVPLQSQNLNGIFRIADSTYTLRINTFRDMLKVNPAVYNTSLSSAIPGMGGVYRGIIPEGFSQEDNMFAANIAVDYEFFDTYGIQLAAGRFFDRDYGTDAASAFIINATAVKDYNFESSENAIGKEINREGKIGNVIGVIKDINFASLTIPISPLILEMREGQYNSLTIKMNSADTQSTIKQLEVKWNELFPDKAFEFNFLDEQLVRQYANYQTFGKIIRWFMFMAILISGLGVYGLILFVSKRRVKEIGIRKVLGASIPGLLLLLCKEFLVLIVIAFVLAIPFSYYLIQNWLENFTYHTDIDFLTYFLSFILVVGVVGITIIFNALKAAMVNPVVSIRME